MISRFTFKHVLIKVGEYHQTALKNPFIIDMSLIYNKAPFSLHRKIPEVHKFPIKWMYAGEN